MKIQVDRMDRQHRVKTLRLTNPSYSVDVVDQDLAVAERLREEANEKSAAIHADPRLTARGKEDDDVALAHATIASLRKFVAPKLDGLDRNIGARKSELVEAGRGAAPSQLHIDAVLDRVKLMSEEDVTVLYLNAPEAEKIALEAAAERAGLLPVKGKDGGIRWRPLIPADRISAARAARSRQANPAVARQIEQLTALRETYVTVFAAAEKAVRAALPHLRLDDDPSGTPSTRRVPASGPGPAERFHDGRGNPVTGAA